MMLRCTWLVPPAIRPAGAAVMASEAGPASMPAGPAGRDARDRGVEAELAGGQLGQRCRGQVAGRLPLTGQAQRLDTAVQPGDLLGVDGTGRSRPAVSVASCRLVRITPARVLPRSRARHRHGDPPAAVEGPEGARPQAGGLR